MSQAQFWSDRYSSAGDQYLFGVEPNHYLKLHRDLIVSNGKSALLVADGEGRNSVWLSEQGLNVTACDISHVAIENAKRLSASREVHSEFICADMLSTEFSAMHLENHCLHSNGT